MTLNYELRREAHAIGEFTATLSFQGAVSPATFANVVPLMREVAETMNLPAPMNVQVFNLGPGMASPVAQANGVGFQRFANNGEIACSLYCDQNSIAFTLREYDRWHNVLPMIIDAFSKIIPAYINEIPAVRIVNVQYLNEFRAKDEEFLNTSEIFRAGNKWISPFSFDSDEPWHCHVGQFINATEDYRNLININCDVSPSLNPLENVARNYVKVLILASCNYDLPDRGPLIVTSENIVDILADNFNSAHKLEKELLREIISDDYLAVMGDGANEH